jgi:hypothetical protein
MDGQERKIAGLIEAFDQEHERARQAITDLGLVGATLETAVTRAAGAAVATALSTMKAEADSAAAALRGLQKLTWWRSALLHFATALAAIVITLVAVRWYVPSVSQMEALRAQRTQLQAALDELGNRGARLQHSLCGDAGKAKRFCVLVPKNPETWDDQNNKSQTYVVPIGY